VTRLYLTVNYLIITFSAELRIGDKMVNSNGDVVEHLKSLGIEEIRSIAPDPINPTKLTHPSPFACQNCNQELVSIGESVHQ